MKLSRRGKRTKRAKCTKRTKNIKCRRNTKRHLNKYKRKNTYRKHSHKLKKNKRVMRGGEENVELEYTTSDGLSKFRNFFGSLQKGNFTTVLACLQEKMKISFNTQSEPFINFDFRNNNFSNEFANVTIQSSSSITNIYYVTFTLTTPDEYYFTLTITNKSDASKTFTVKFKVLVSSYTINFDKRNNSSEYECGSIGYNISFHVDNEDYQEKYDLYGKDSNPQNMTPQNMTFTRPPKQGETTSKTYTFPLSVKGSVNNSYFKNVQSNISDKIKEIINQILKTSISIRIKDSKKSEDKGLMFDIGGEKTALVGQLRSQVAKYLKTETGNIILTLQPFESTERISLQDEENLASCKDKGTFYYEKLDLQPSDVVSLDPDN